MNFRSLARLAGPAVAGLLSLGMSLGSHAHSGPQDPIAVAQPRMQSAACDAARRSAWFERQRQLTDGDVNPFAQPKDPAECMDMRAASDATMAPAARQDVEAKNGKAA